MDKALINKRVLTALNYIIESHNVTKSALAEVLDIKPAKFSEILNERMNAGVDIMATICVTYNISADWLLTGEGSMLRGGTVQVSGSGNAVVGNSHNSTATVNATPTDTSDLRAMVEEQRTIIEGLQGQLQEKDKQIAQLLAIISKK